MKYVYENLGEDQFEKLIVFLCHELLGIATQGFAKGVDGGRDAKFVGKAQLFPSTTEPWVGITIIQAKHTNGYNRNFSERDFYNPKPGTESIIAGELPKIKNLRDKKQLDHYMLFANRRLGANAESEIRSYISKPTGVPPASIYLCGVEQLEVWLKKFPTIATLANLDLVDSPLIISPDELSEVVQAFAKHKVVMKVVLDDPPTPRVSYADKNVTNNMTKQYAAAQLKMYLKETAQISRFLAAPENEELLRMYESVVEEFQLKIIGKRKDYQTFDEIMNHLIDLLFDRDPILRQHAHKRLTRAMLFYMYWNCDIGETGDAQTNQTFAS
jgi:hypothetical protein